ncbi:MAG: TetR/AcrR family transcriptional regulator [Chloroflexi bacterium]|nr:MAG: TetR/AcrR family transcriptional regulator [Chloroflexota bacterium]
MKRGEQTRNIILEQTAILFNKRGVAGTTMSDIMAVTGLQKGGIYNHFASKDELALAAFDKAWEQVKERFEQLLFPRQNSIDRLHALLNLFLSYSDNPPIEGGCPVLNTAIEADDTNPALLEKARSAIQEWRDFIVRTVERGIKYGEIKPETDADMLADMLVASLEGAVALSRIDRSVQPLEHVLSFLRSYLEREVRISP